MLKNINKKLTFLQASNFSMYSIPTSDWNIKYLNICLVTCLISLSSRNDPKYLANGLSKSVTISSGILPSLT